MKTSRWTLIICFLCIIIAYAGYRLTHRTYIREVTGASHAKEQKDYYSILKAIASLPKTKLLLEASPKPTISADQNVVLKNLKRGDIDAEIFFPKIDDFHDVTQRSARIFVAFPRAIDVTNTLLMARAGTWGTIVLGGHLSTRLQFELYDEQGRVMRGPKVVVQKNGESFILILRPTITEPIPTGFTDPDFDTAHVVTIAIRLTLGIPKETERGGNFSGGIHVGELVAVSNFNWLIGKAFTRPDTTRVTQDGLNLGYDMRRIAWGSGKHEFFVGINYPWGEYGWDFGRNPWNPDPKSHNGWAIREKTLTENFLAFRTSGITHIRMYMFCDFRTGLVETKDGYALDEFVLADTEAMLRAAEKTGMKLIPVLVDFGIGNTAVGEYIRKGSDKSKPDLVFSARKYQFFREVMIPYLKQLENLNNAYGKPIEALELMNEPDNTALLMVPGYYDSLKAWLTDLAVAIHEETTIKVTLGARSFADFRRWWNDVPVDAYQFHFYEDMIADMPPVPINVPRSELDIPGHQLVFCGELDPHNMELTIPELKARGYDGALLWGFASSDGFKVDLEKLKIVIGKLKSPPEKKPKQK